MFELPHRFSKQGRPEPPAGWEYVDELEAIAEWLSAGPDRSPELAQAVAGMDTFRGAETVKRWLHNVASAHGYVAEGPAAFLDRLVEGRRLRGEVPARAALDAEISSRLEALEYLCTIPDNYRCALLLKEGTGLTVERTAFLMGVSKASLRSILYRARRAVDSRAGQSKPQR
jgi:DNA-directed RNA polymerase specialized sigma24 family protein